MVTMDSLEAQLKKVDFNSNGWGRSEARELVNILHDDEEIYDLVNGYYEAGFALLVATDSRVMIVDKKPLNYLTVEEVRYDMIAEIDYSHRLLTAHVNIATGNNKMMRFTSLNQKRLRKTIGHIQHRMATTKKDQTGHAADQKEHLSQINQQLQTYLLAQHQQQQSLKEQLDAVKEGQKAPAEVNIEPVKPSHELSDYLFAQSLLAQAKQQHPELVVPVPDALVADVINVATTTPLPPYSEHTINQTNELYAEGMKEIFGKHNIKVEDDKLRTKRAKKYGKMAYLSGGIDINPFRIVYKTTAKSMKARKKNVQLSNAFHAPF